MTFTIPNIFVAGKKAVAYEVNENFNALKDELNRQNDSIIQNTTTIDETKEYLEGELQEELVAISNASGGKCSVNSGHVDAQGNAHLLTMPSLGTQWIAWGQPVAKNYTTSVPLPDGDSGSMVITSSNDTGGAAWRAMDGKRASTDSGWRAYTTANPQWWQVKFPYQIKIFGLQHINVDSGFSSTVTGRFYTDSSRVTPIGNSISTPSTNNSQTTITGIPTEGIITDTIYFQRTSGGEYSGIGELVISAQWQITLSAATILPLNAGGEYPDLAVTFPDNKQRVFNYLEPLSVSTEFVSKATLTSLGNGTHTLLLTIEGTYNLGRNLYSQSYAPTNPSGSDVWVDNSTSPAKVKYYEGLNGDESNTWIEINSVPIGSFTIQNGIFTECTTLPYNSLKQILSGQNKEYTASLAMPSDKYIDMTLPASGGTLTAPASGYFYVNKNATTTGQYIQIVNTTTGLGLSIQPIAATSAVRNWVPCKKDNTVTITYSVAGATNNCRFVYAEGGV